MWWSCRRFNAKMTSTCWLQLTACIMAHIILFNNEVSNAMPITTRPAQTSTDIPYVEKEEENEPCFNITNEDGVGCREGNWYNVAARDTGRYCTKCQNLQNGTGTYQPYPNQCPTCIICPKCEEGHEEVTPCSKTKPPECREIRNNITESTVGSPFDSNEKPSTSGNGEEIRTTLPVSKRTPKADIPPKEESADKENHTDHGWETFGYFSIGIILILLFFMMILIMCLCRACKGWYSREPFPVFCCNSPSKETSNGEVARGPQPAARPLDNNNAADASPEDEVASGSQPAAQSPPDSNNAAEPFPQDEALKGNVQIPLRKLSAQNGGNAEELEPLTGPTQDNNDAADEPPEDKECVPLNAGPTEDDNRAADEPPEDEGPEQILLHNLSSQNGDNAEERQPLYAGPTQDDNRAADEPPEDEVKESTV